MKKLFLMFAVILIAVSVNAQKHSISNATKFSIGIEPSLPVGTFNNPYDYKFGIGASAQIEQNVASNMGLTLNAGYLSFSNTQFTGSKFHLNVIPVMAGVKLWFSPKVYGHGQLGVSFNSISGYSGVGSKTGFAYSPGIGFFISNNVDLLIKYFGNNIGSGSSINNSIYVFMPSTAGSIGARLALSF